MSWTEVVPYFRAIGETPSLDLKYWPDPFNKLNIPSNIIDGAMHIELGPMQGKGLNMHVQDSTVLVDVAILKKGFVDVDAARADMVQLVENYVKECVRPSLRLTECIKNVVFNNGTITPGNIENDNLLLALLTFEARVMFRITN